MATKKITPKSPEAKAKDSTDDRTADRTSARKTATIKGHPRKIGRKTGASRWG